MRPGEKLPTEVVKEDGMRIYYRALVAATIGTQSLPHAGRTVTPSRSGQLHIARVLIGLVEAVVDGIRHDNERPPQDKPRREGKTS